MNKLHNALRLNALFSAISGVLLIILNSQIAKIFGTENNKVFWITGLVLIFFTTTIVIEIIKQRLLAVIWIIIQDFIWVIGSIVLLLFDIFPITTTGKIMIAIVAFIVLLMGLNQTRALNKTKGGA